MSRTFALFGELGPNLGTAQSGEVLTIDAASQDINRTGRGSIAQDGDAHYFEVMVWASEDTDSVSNRVSIGVVTEDASLSTYVGGDAFGIGYRLAEGEIHVGGSSVQSVTAGGAGDIVGVLLDLEQSTATFYLNGAILYTYDLDTSFDGATWYIGVSLGSGTAADLRAFLKSGQWTFEYPNPASDGWYTVPPRIATLHLATESFISRPTDETPSQVFDGCIPQSNLSIAITRGLSFWPQGDSPVVLPSVANLTILDPDGVYDDLVSGDVRDIPITLYELERGTALDDATLIGRFLIDRVEAQDDMRKVLRLKDAAVVFSNPLQKRLFLPNVEANAANRPIPISLGAPLSVTPVLYRNDAEDLLYKLHDRPLNGVGEIRDRGDRLSIVDSPPDFEITEDFEGIRLFYNPDGKLTADVSSVGGEFPVPPSELAPQSLAGWDSVDNVTELGGLYTFNDDGSEAGNQVEAYLSESGVVVGGNTYRWRVEITDKSLYFGNGQISKLDLGWSTTNQYQVFATFTAAGSYSGTQSFPAVIGTQPLVVRMRGTQGDDDFIQVPATSVSFKQIPADDIDSSLLEPINAEDFADEIFSRAGIDANQWSREDLQEVDAITGYRGIGFHTQEQITVQEALEPWLNSYTMCLVPDRTGVFRFYRMVAPEDMAAESPSPLQGEITTAVILRNTELRVWPDEARGLTTNAVCQKNWTVLDNTDFVNDYDPVTGVPMSVRRKLARAYREAVFTGGRLASAYNFALSAAPHETLFADVSACQAEIDRIRAIYSVQRYYYEVQVPIESAEQYDLNQLWTLRYPRYGLDDGKPVLVHRITEDRARRTATLTLWG